MTSVEIMQFIIDETKKQAVENGSGGFGAAVVIDGEIVATGFNRVGLDQDPTAHGEIVAIRNAAKKLGVRFPEGTELYTTSQSCPMCVAAAIWSGIGKIYFGATCEYDGTKGCGDAHVYAYLRGDEDPRLLIQEQIEEEAPYAEEMIQWFAKRFENENSK